MARNRRGAPGEQRIEKFPHTGRDTSKRFQPRSQGGSRAGNTQRMISGVDPSSPDKSKRFTPKPVR